MANLSRVEDKDDNLELINKIVSELAKEKPQLFTHQQLKSFTSGFTNKVGHGAFGNVYKGVFPDGTQIVVKVLKNNMPDVIQRHDITKLQFIAEVSTMGRTYHRNLIKLYGFCFDADIKALVYEYMENGSLDRVLYENHLRLEWVELYDIAIETAKGISYLHENCNPIIIHHDIKAANVLLDSSLSPKVTDFGLAKLCKINVSKVAQSRFRGTEGYAAPEVCLGSKLITYKCDVYSFGMMLFEILRRKKNNDAEDWFPGKFWEYFENKQLDEVLIECGIMEKDKEKAKRLSMVALTCAHIYPQDRPSMSTVVKMLEGEIQPRPPRTNPFPYYDSSSGESSISGSSTRTRSLPPVVLPAYDKSLDEEGTTHKEYASSLTVRQPLKDTTIEVISSVDDEQVVIPTRQPPTSSKEPESNSTFESVEESCPAGVENSVIVYASTVPNSNIPYNSYFSGESSLGTRNVPPIVSPAFDEKYKFTPVAGKLHSFFKRLATIEEGSTHEEYGSSHTMRQPLKASAVNVKGSIDGEKVENSVIVYASTVPNSNIPYNGYFSGESSLGTRNVPPIVSPAFDEKYKFTPVAGKPHSFFKRLATIEEGSTHEEYGSSHTVRQPLKGSALNVKGSIDGKKVFNPTRQQSLPKSCEAKGSCPPGDDESVVSNAPGHKSGFSLSSFIPSWSRPKTGGSQKGWKLTLGNLSTGFIPEAATKGNIISILAFEVANTIVKGATLMQSLSKENIEHLKEVVLPSEGVQYLVSKDRKDLLRIAAADKREELKIFSGEVVRFGNRCKDPQWHNLHSYFEKMGKEVVTQKQLKEEAETVMQQLMTMAQYTAELYHELHALDRFEQDYHRKLQEEDNSSAAQRGDDLAILRAELKSQRKHARSLKKKSLWCKILEEVMEKLVDAVYFLHLEIHDAFGSADTKKPLKGSQNNHQRLGPAGLALHYANIITQIDTLVSRSSSVPPNTRDTLYQGLPPSVKSALRSKLQSFEVKEELTVTQIKAEMEKTLQWLVPIATNTTKAHHSFGWVGEWANTVSEVNRKAAGQTELIKIETLHYADKEKTEACILELIVWLHHTTKSPTRVPTQKTIPLEIFPVRRFPVIDFDMDWNVIEAGSPE